MSINLFQSVYRLLVWDPIKKSGQFSSMVRDSNLRVHKVGLSKAGDVANNS